MCVVDTPGFYGATITYSTPEYAYYRQSGENEINSLFCRLRCTLEETLAKKSKWSCNFLRKSSARLAARSSARIMTKQSETNSLVYEIVHNMNLYDLCLEILLTNRLEELYWLINFVTGTLYSYACADATGQTAVTTVKGKH